MKSNVCMIRSDSNYLDVILKESEKVSVYNELNHKQAMHLRLLTEELNGMIKELVGYYNGKFWIDFEDGVCKLNASMSIDEITYDRRKELIGIAKNKKNANATGVVGKIRALLEGIFLDDDIIGNAILPLSSVSGDVPHAWNMGYTKCWSLDSYKNNAKEKKEAWDELEKSVIAKVADDVIVGIKGRLVDVIIVKNFK